MSKTGLIIEELDNKIEDLMKEYIIRMELSKSVGEIASDNTQIRIDVLRDLRSILHIVNKNKEKDNEEDPI